VRHSYSTAALAVGMPAKVVGERLGHANIAITMDTYSLATCCPAWTSAQPASWLG
jgi:integrase